MSDFLRLLPDSPRVSLSTPVDGGTKIPPFCGQQARQSQTDHKQISSSFPQGGLPPVALNVETRSGNKKVTLVTNLETYGVNPGALGKEIRVQAAASTSVSAAPGQKLGAKQLLIQGNQVNLVVTILTEKYNIDKKHISGMEKGEKKKKR